MSFYIQNLSNVGQFAAGHNHPRSIQRAIPIAGTLPITEFACDIELNGTNNSLILTPVPSGEDLQFIVGDTVEISTTGLFDPFSSSMSSVSSSSGSSSPGYSCNWTDFSGSVVEVPSPGSARISPVPKAIKDAAPAIFSLGTLESGTCPNCAARLHYPFKRATLIGKKSSTQDNAGDILIGTNIASPSYAIPPGGEATIIMPHDQIDDIANWKISTSNNGDGIILTLWS